MKALTNPIIAATARQRRATGGAIVKVSSWALKVGMLLTITAMSEASASPSKAPITEIVTASPRIMPRMFPGV